MVAPSLDALESCIKSKSDKATSFEALDVHEAWLVVHAPGRALSDLFPFDMLDKDDYDHLTNLASSNTVKNFHRVFLWDGFGENIYQLYPCYAVVLNKARELYVNRLPEFLKPFLRLP